MGLGVAGDAQDLEKNYLYVSLKKLANKSLKNCLLSSRKSLVIGIKKTCQSVKQPLG